MIVKRIFDVVFALILLVVLSPLMIVIAIAILTTMGRPIFFLQERPGLYGKPFRIIKFRTMQINNAPSDPRVHTSSINNDAICDLHTFVKEFITPLGGFLRAFSLDEFPQLFNILKGEMSFVGPRPSLMDYLDIYTEDQKRRHNVLPGITGLAQVMGRNSLSWEKRLEYDTYYVDHHSFWFDIKIILLTIKQVLLRDGAEGRSRKNG